MGLSAPPLAPPLGRGEGLEILSSVSSGQLFNRSRLFNETSIKAPKQEGSESFQASEHMEVPGGCPGKHGSSAH